MALGMRMITMLLTTALLLGAGCRDPGDGPFDAGINIDLCGSDCVHPLPLCAPAAEQSNGLRCDYGVDTQCKSSHGYDCTCACTGYWECDQVKIACDPDAGVPHD
jgi:hypothetical protein